MKNLQSDLPRSHYGLFALGFRSLFLLAGLGGFALILAWLLYQHHGVMFAGLSYYTPNLWHAHEMVFGYTMAVIGGFLLTAIVNWTRRPTSTPLTLALLSFIWIMGRLVAFIPSIPGWLVAFVDSLYLIMLAVMIAIPLIQAGNKRNYFMIGLVSLFAIINITVHGAILSGEYGWARSLTNFVFYWVLLLIVVMAGRVFPMFSQNGVPERYVAKRYANIELMIPPMMIAWILTLSLAPQMTWLWGGFTLINMVLHGIRLYGWYNHQIWLKPLVWVLHIGYLMLIIGFGLMFAMIFKPGFYYLALHVLTIGCLGIITVGMMTRVSYGHSGRNLHNPPKLLGPIFGLLVLSVIVRSILPLLGVLSHFNGMLISGGLWVLAFLLFVIRYIPVWFKPREDGQPG
ncbi:NnrS family protein [Marinicella gelatinilytica]|uniref:NnrS family protein n=1 Tax=Marinicella gelatinilytica TaxID=2996017 RepID=UPI002260C2FE|nr:NnrS family protein [Marinicella gelatinilytica]MCX7545052.1 NnrS family protein [Marinicella gelatinilytica]